MADDRKAMENTKSNITANKVIYQCYRISNGQHILTHFNGKSEFESLDELFHLININFDVEQHDFVIKAKINDKTIPIELEQRKEEFVMTNTQKAIFLFITFVCIMLVFLISRSIA